MREVVQSFPRTPRRGKFNYLCEKHYAGCACILFFLYAFLFSLGKHIGLLYWIAISFQTANSGGYLVGGLAVIILSSFLSFFLGGIETAISNDRADDSFFFSRDRIDI